MAGRNRCRLPLIPARTLTPQRRLSRPSEARALAVPLRTHPDEPFVSYAPQQLGDMEIKPGEKYVSKYRFVVADGAPDKALIDRIWNDFAEPPTVILVGQ